MRHRALTVVAPIAPGKAPVLERYLARLEHPKRPRHPTLDFNAVPGVHFARFVVIAGRNAGDPSLLVLETNYDERPEIEHLHDLVKGLGAPLRQIYSRCTGHASSQGDTVAFMRRHTRPAAAFYVGQQGFGRERIRKDIAIRARIEAFLDSERADHPEIFADPKAVFARVRAALAGAELGPEPGESPSYPWFPPLGIAAGAAVLAVLLAIFPVTVAFLLRLFQLEARDAEIEGAKPARRDTPERTQTLTRIALREDAEAENPLTHLVTIKPGLVRGLVLRLVLFGIGLLGHHVYCKGRLGELATIHFARWVILDDGRLLFFSNYDGSWESYLGDFVDKESLGLTGIWSNTEGYPPTRFLIGAGAKDEERFKAWTRDKQVLTQLWYNAYPNTSVTNVWNNAAIRTQLAQTNPTREEAQAWLRIL